MGHLSSLACISSSLPCRQGAPALHHLRSHPPSLPALLPTSPAKGSQCLQAGRPFAAHTMPSLLPLPSTVDLHPAANLTCGRQSVSAGRASLRCSWDCEVVMACSITPCNRGPLSKAVLQCTGSKACFGGPVTCGSHNPQQPKQLFHASVSTVFLSTAA